jgi:tetratricopeptide (TPR) repeat protein
VTRLQTGAALVLFAALVAAGCTYAPVLRPAPALHIEDVASEGDETRRASVRLVVEGLRADEAGRSERARGLYQRALQVDSGNPYAYLALARQSVARGESELALEYVARAEDLLDADGLRTPGVEPHLEGLRGAALSLSDAGDRGADLLERAATLAPAVWGDGRLDADELR